MCYSRAAFSALMVALLFGCQTAAQHQFEAMKSGNEAAIAQSKACNTAVYDSPESASLRLHLPQNVNDATLQQLSDSSMVTPAEWQAILATHPKFQQCRKALLEALMSSEPGAVPILAASYNEIEDDLLALSDHKLTWGQYIRRARDRVTKTQASLQAEDRRVIAGLQQEHEAEIAQRQRAAEALAAWAQTQEMINAANRPVITNCNGVGNTVNCVSH